MLWACLECVWSSSGHICRCFCMYEPEPSLNQKSNGWDTTWCWDNRANVSWSLSGKKSVQPHPHVQNSWKLKYVGNNKIPSRLRSFLLLEVEHCTLGCGPPESAPTSFSTSVVLLFPQFALSLQLLTSAMLNTKEFLLWIQSTTRPIRDSLEYDTLQRLLVRFTPLHLSFTLRSHSLSLTTGSLRFREPQLPSYTTGVQLANTQPSQCFQAGEGTAPKTPFRNANYTVPYTSLTRRLETRSIDVTVPGTSEDCLFLKYLFRSIWIGAYTYCDLVVSMFPEIWEKRKTFRLLSGYTGMYQLVYLPTALVLSSLSICKGRVRRRQCVPVQWEWFSPWGWRRSSGCHHPVSARSVWISTREESQRRWGIKCWFVWVPWWWKEERRLPYSSL